MQGADLVNDELEVGFDEVFERRWHRAEQFGRVFMVLFVAAGLAGLFGVGPYSHHTDKTSDAALAVDFEPVARSQTGTQITLHLSNLTDMPTQRLFISSHVVEPMGLQLILPQPVNTQALNDGLLLTFAVPAGTQDALVRLMLQPSGVIGLEHLEARLEGHAALRWTQLIVP